MPVAGVDTLEAAPELAAMLAVSRLVAAGGPLEALLDRVAAEAAGVVGARLGQHPAARRARGLPAGGRLRAEPRPTRRCWTARPRSRPGTARPGWRSQRGGPVAIADTEHDEEFAPWRPVARTEGYRAMVSVPLTSGRGDDRRAERLPAASRPVAASASSRCCGSSASTRRARSAPPQLIERQTRQVGALARLVRGLREQTHEHANQLHADPRAARARRAGGGAAVRRASSRPRTTSPTGASPARSSSTSSPGCCWPRPRSPSSAGSRCEIDDASRLERAAATA